MTKETINLLNELFQAQYEPKDGEEMPFFSAEKSWQTGIEFFFSKNIGPNKWHKEPFTVRQSVSMRILGQICEHFPYRTQEEIDQENFENRVEDRYEDSKF